MKSTFLYVVLTVIAVALIAVTISLQVMLLSEREPAVELGLIDSASNQQAPQQANAANQSGNGSGAVAQQVQPTPLPTNTPMIIFVRPTPAPPTLAAPTAAAAPLAPAPTAIQIAQLPPAEEPKFDPKSLLLGANNVLTSEDYGLLASVLISNPDAIGVIPFAYYQSLNASLRPVKLQVGGIAVEPTQETVESGFYPLARNLYIYASLDTVKAKPDVAAFVSCYLRFAPTESPLAGYFAPPAQELQRSINNLQISIGNVAVGPLPECSAAGLGTTVIETSGSSTVAPLTGRMAELFKAQGFQGEISITSKGTASGFQEFCENGIGDIVNADRRIKDSEREQCRAVGRELVEFTVAQDAMVVATAADNTFLDSLTFDMIWRIFSTANTWSEVDAEWPASSIVRVIPGAQSGTLELFVDTIYKPGATQLAQGSNGINASTTVLAPATAEQDTTAPTAIPDTTVQVEPTAQPVSGVDYIIGYHEGRSECSEVANLLATILEERYERQVDLLPFNNTDSMYENVARNSPNLAQQIDFTPCYTDRDDRVYLRANGSKIALMNNAYAETAQNKLFLAAHSSLPPTLKFEDSCVYEFLRNVNMGLLPAEGLSTTSWIDANEVLLNEWTRCEEGN